jgi:hypothetical protein
MRVKLLFDKGIFGSIHKCWFDSYESNTVYDLINEIRKSFEISMPISIQLDGFFIHPTLTLNSVVRSSELLLVQPKDLNSESVTENNISSSKVSKQTTEQKVNLKSILKNNYKTLLSQNQGKKLCKTNKICTQSPLSCFKKDLKTERNVKGIMQQKLSSLPSSAPGLISKRFPVLPHELHLGDRVSISSTDNPLIIVISTQHGTVAGLQPSSLLLSTSIPPLDSLELPYSSILELLKAPH